MELYKTNSSLQENEEKMSASAIKDGDNWDNLSNAEEGYPGKKGVAKEVYFSNELLTYLEINSEKVFEGDIILTDE